MATAIFYHPDGYETNRERLMGRHAAGEGMLKALCQHVADDKLFCYCTEEAHFKHFVKKVKSFSSRDKVCSWVHPSRWQTLKEAGSLFMAGPVLSDLAWLRRHGNVQDFSLCGVTHTTATDRAMDAIGDLVTAPLYPWDALVCTSQSVRTMVKRVLQEYQDYLADRFKSPLPAGLPVELPVIPLGVDCGLFDLSEEKRAEHRSQWRQKLGISDSTPVVLYVGRFSFHDKAHPVPMYMALEECAQLIKKPLCLVMAGWFQNDAMKHEFVKAANLFCPSVKVAIVDGRNPAVRNTIWYAADVFTSLSDNVQETFGLTPIEAMAAGLPVVVSDWDGYKETVRHGIDGYRIPTWTAPPGIGVGLAMSYASGADSYGNYVGYQSQFTSVDVHACARAFAYLLKNEATRKQMGEAGKERARTVFDWQVVIRQYEALWKHQAEVRSKSEIVAQSVDIKPGNPLRNDPFSLFAHYPTHLITPDTLIIKFPAATRELLDRIRSSKITIFGGKLAYQPDQITELLEALPAGEAISVQSLCSKVPANEGMSLIFSLLWLSKVGLIGLSPSPAYPKVAETVAGGLKS